MKAPRFVPLVCPSCGGDLAGRSVDRAAFCVPCGLALRCDGEEPVRLPLATVRELPPGDEQIVHLPFWLDGTAVAPAFITQRPLTLARVAAGLLDEWPARRELSDPVPFGARLDPAALDQVCRLARIPPPSIRAPLALLAVPARADGERFRLPRFSGELYRGDVVEAAALRALAGAERPAATRLP